MHVYHAFFALRFLILVSFSPSQFPFQEIKVRSDIDIMAKPMHISDVTAKSDNWRVKVLVVEKSNVYTNDRGKRLQKLMLLDEQGDRVEGLMWNTNINVLEGSLKPFTTYVVGGAQVEAIKPGFQYATPDIVAVVINVKEPRLVDVRGKLTPIRECTVVQDELSPLMLTLWAEFAEQQGAELFALKNDMPIILCKGLRAKSFAGLSVSTVPFSFVSLEPTIPEVTRLHNWLDTHLEAVQQISRKPTTNYLEKSLATFTEAEAKKLCDILPDSQAMQCAVKMAIMDIHQQVTYTTCPKCKQTQKALPYESFPCHTCNEEQIAEPRCKVIVRLTDQSCTIDATLFDTCAESLLSHTPREIHAMKKQEIALYLHKINRTLDGQQVIAQLRASKKKFNDKVTRYTVQHWIENKSDIATAANCSIIGESAEQTTALETSPAKSNDNTLVKTYKSRSGTEAIPTAKTNTNTKPMKKLKLRSADEV